MSEPFRFRMGVDENGLGPRLGPLVVTSVLAEVTELGHRNISRKPRGKLKELIGDSKEILSHGDISIGEAWARQIAARASSGAAPETIDQLLSHLSLDPRAVLEKPCPSNAHAQCWSNAGETFESESPLLKQVSRGIDLLESQGVRVISAKSVIVCTHMLNEGKRGQLTRFQMDLHSMERLILDAREKVDGDILAVCGKVGGLGYYERAFKHLAGRLLVTLEETRKLSAYHFPQLGQVRFEMDADARDQLVSLASIVGKWVREVLMGRIVRHYRQHDQSLPDASGYHDPVTTQFVEKTSLVRKKKQIPSSCFERI